MRATGIPWNFAPCICVTRDARWGRSYESFGEDPLLVVRDGDRGRRRLAGHRQRDLDQNDHVLATVKHFAGDGDTKYGTSAGDYTIDQGVTITNRRDFARINLAPYWPAIRGADAGSAMPSFSSVDWTEDGVGNPIKMHQNQELITGVLKGQMRARRLRDQRLGRHPPAARRLHQPGPARRQRGHRHVHGTEHLAGLRQHAHHTGERQTKSRRRGSTTRSPGS